MIKCICIDDSNKPDNIPANKWPVAGEFYHIIMIVTVMPQGVLAYHLAEINLSDDELPYEYFKASRFGVRIEDLPLVADMIEATDEACQSVDDLLSQIKITEKQLA